jgi:hypothetical protein
MRQHPMSSQKHQSTFQPIETNFDLNDKDEFWRAVHVGFARLRSDPVAWAEYLNEAALWESASNDGLEDEQPYFTDESSLTPQSG